MENATKALLIAAAILVAILIISLALVVYRMAADTVGSANLSEAELAAHNGKYEAAAGPKVSGSAVNALLVTIASNNADPERKVLVEVDGGTGDDATGADVVDSTPTVDDDFAFSVTKVPTGRYYTVTLNYENGLVSEVVIRNN